MLPFPSSLKIFRTNSTASSYLRKKYSSSTACSSSWACTFGTSVSSGSLTAFQIYPHDREKSRTGSGQWRVLASPFSTFALYRFLTVWKVASDCAILSVREVDPWPDGLSVSAPDESSVSERVMLRSTEPPSRSISDNELSTILTSLHSSPPIKTHVGSKPVRVNINTAGSATDGLARLQSF
jgi:hypothetical protein